MARGSSIINVAIIGDARKLIGAVADADRATGGLLGSAAKVYVSGKTVRKGFDLVNDALAEADRRGDALTRLENQIGPLATELERTSGGFTGIGASKTDMLELEAIYADLATSAGVAEPDIAATAVDLAAAATAAAQVHDADPSAIIEAIGKAVGGQTRGLKDYGVDLTEAAVQQRALRDTGKDNPKLLTDTELAAARTSLIMEAFAPILADVSTGSADVAQKQDILGAKAEDAGAAIGAAAEGPVTAALDLILWMAEAAPGAAEGWMMLGDVISQTAQNLFEPLANLRDLIGDILGGLGDLAGARVGNDPVGDALANILGGGGRSDAQIAAAVSRDRERNGLGR